MKKLVNILCIFAMLTVAGTASAGFRIVITEGQPTEYIYNPFADTESGVFYRQAPEDSSQRMRRERLQYDLEREALQYGMSVEKFVHEKLQKIQ